MRSTYKIVETEREVEELIGYCLETRYCSFDFETSSLKYYEDSEYPTVIGISFQIGSAWVVPLGHFDSPFKDKWRKVLRGIGKALMLNPNIIKIGWNLKYEWKWFHSVGIELRGRVFDAMLAKYPLDEERPNGLKENTERFLPEFAGYGLAGSKSDKFNWAAVPLEELSKYCAMDCDNSFRMFLYFESKLMELGLYPLYRNMFCMLVRVLGKCEAYGIDIRTDYLQEQVVKYGAMIVANDLKIRDLRKIKKYQKKLIAKNISNYLEMLEEKRSTAEEEGRDLVVRNTDAKIRQISAGVYSNKEERGLVTPINFDSPKQMAELLYLNEDGFNLPVLEYTDSGQPSSAEETLLKLKDKEKSGFIDALLKNRELAKLDSTYISGIQKKLSSKGKIHCSYKINGTVTGRLSSTDPNMQNVPRMTTNPDIKPMFIPPPGCLWVELDYSQAELRIVAELAKEDKMIEWFKEGHNIHMAVAIAAENANNGGHLTYDEIYPISKDKAHPKNTYWTKRKKRAKTINFGILYEQSPRKLAETMNKDVDAKDRVTISQAEEFMAEWFKTFPRIKKWIDGQHKKVKKDGFVTNMFGFKRRLPKVYSDKYGEMLEATRQSVNAPIQGAASFFTLFSGIVLEEQRIMGYLPTDYPLGYTVHDSLGYWVYPKDIHDFFRIAVPICANPQTQDFFGFQLKYVNMKASMEVGTNWGDKQDYSKKEDYTKWKPFNTK